MARLKALPAAHVIRAYRGVLDFYVWRGLPCVRAWPRFKATQQTAASKASAATFGIILRAFALVGGEVKALYALDAQGQPRTGRDLYVSGALGHLHETQMSDFLDLLTEAVALLNTIETLTHALGTVDTDDLQVDVKSSTLPALAATAAHQVTQNSALAEIADLQDALESKALDRLLVRGMDQLPSFQAALAQRTAGAISGANGYFDSAPAGAGSVWVVTSVAAKNATNPCTAIEMLIRVGASNFRFSNTMIALPAGQWFTVQCHKWLDPTDLIRIYFRGGQAGDACEIEISGHYFTLET